MALGAAEPGRTAFAVFLAGFMASSVLWCFFCAGLIAWTRRHAGAATWKVPHLGSAAGLACFAWRVAGHGPEALRRERPMAS